MGGQSGRSGRLLELLDQHALVVVDESGLLATRRTPSGRAHLPSDEATSEKVRFQVGADEEMVGNLYLPARLPSGERRPAVVVGTSLNSVKEQMGAPSVRNADE